jgi:hypothetical protein
MSIKYLRSFRLFDIALFDLVLSFVAVILITVWLGYSPWLGAAITLPLSILTHAILGINTQLNYYLGISDAPDR